MCKAKCKVHCHREQQILPYPGVFTVFGPQILSVSWISAWCVFQFISFLDGNVCYRYPSSPWCTGDSSGQKTCLFIDCLMMRNCISTWWENWTSPRGPGLWATCCNRGEERVWYTCRNKGIREYVVTRGMGCSRDCQLSNKIYSTFIPGHRAWLFPDSLEGRGGGVTEY